jgi:hypothetical protein
MTAAAIAAARCGDRLMLAGADDPEISRPIFEGIGSWRRIMMGRQAHVSAHDILRMAARELCDALKIDATVHPQRRDITHQAAVDGLLEIAELGDVSPDDAQEIFALALARKPNDDGKKPAGADRKTARVPTGNGRANAGDGPSPTCAWSPMTACRCRLSTMMP